MAAIAHRLPLFIDRRDAGRMLAAELARFAAEDPVIVALPRGGVPVAFEVAAALGAPLDIVLVRKLGAPMQPELGIGAVAEGGVSFVREADLELLGIGAEELAEVTERETAELERRRRRYRGEREPIAVEGRTVIVIDDGIATGGTAIAAARSLRARGAARIVLAAPVAPPEVDRRLGDEFDEIVCVHRPSPFIAIGAFYARFDQVGDDEVIELLARARGDVSPPPADQASEPGDPGQPGGPGGRREVRQIAIEAAPGAVLHGELAIPAGARGLALFAHGTGSSRLSPRNRGVAAALNDAGLATLLFDLLTEAEAPDRAKAFEIGLLAERVIAAARWAEGEAGIADLRLGLFGASTGAAAALVAAAELGDRVGAVVSRGGRPDLAAERLGEVVAPTLLIVGGADLGVLALNERAVAALGGEASLAVVPGAGHLFEEPGALERVAALAAEWFLRHLG